MRIKIFQLMLIFCPVLLVAQQDPMISQYMFVGSALNPAYVGSHKYTNATLLHRYQWASIATNNATDEFNPTTTMFTLDGRSSNEKLGFGLILANDQYGIAKKNDVVGNVAYHLKVRGGALALGFRGGLSFYNANMASLTLYTNNYDPAFASNGENKVLGNIGTGAYYYSDKSYIGISIPHWIGNSLHTDDSKLVNHYFIHGGHVIEANDFLAIKPSVLVKYVPNTPVEFDFNVNLFIAKMFSIGASYRTGDSFVGLIEIQATKNLRLGYSYDKLFTELNNFSTGSHELMVSWDFGAPSVTVRTPRFF